MSATARQKISRQQMRLMWALARDHGYDSEGLHDLVEDVVGSSSISRLTRGQASRVIDRLKPAKRPRRDPRPGMASAKQLGMIHGIWRELGDEHSFYRPGQRAGALREILSKRFGVADVRFLTVAKARSVIQALIDIRGRMQV